MLAACALPIVCVHAKTPQPDDAGDGDISLSGTLAPPLTSESKDLPRVELTSQIMFQVLASEIALQRGQPANAYRTYMSLAHSTHDPRMAQRATEIALAAQSPDDAMSAAQVWYQYAPDSSYATQADAALLVLTGRPDDAKPVLARELARAHASKRGEAILALQRLIAHGPNRIGGLSVLKDLLKGDMNRPEAQVAIGRQQLLADDAPEARKSLDAALALQPDCLSAAQTLVRMEPPARDKGIAALERYLHDNPRAHDARLLLAQTYVTASRLDEAKKQYLALHDVNSKDLAPLFALGLINAQQKKADEAQRYLLQYVQQAQQMPGIDPGQAYFALAQIALNQQNYSAASDWLTRVPPGSAQYFLSQITRVQVLNAQGKTSDARTLLASINVTDARGRALVARADGELLLDAQRYPEALKRLAGAVQDFPDDPDLIYDYATAAEETGQYDLMETQLRQLIAMQPDNAEAWNALGYSLANRNVRLPEAEKLLEKAIALAPDNGAIMDSVGWLKYREGKLADAIKLIRRAYSMQANVEIGAHLGEVLWMSGDKAGAFAAWREALKLKPEHGPGSDALKKTLQRFNVRESDL
jgi:tetratricopeptide (TPR) repeat protein